MKLIIYVLSCCLLTAVGCTKEEEAPREELPPKVNPGICPQVVLFDIQSASASNQSISIRLDDCGAGYLPLDNLWIEHTANSNVFHLPNGITLYSLSSSGLSEVTYTDPQLNLQLDLIHDSIFVKDSTKTYGHFYY
jgi:hypothetical protein